MQAQIAAHSAFDEIIERQRLVERARQDNQLAARYKSVLGFSARLQAFCQSHQYAQVLPAYREATILIQTQPVLAHSSVDWSVLQKLMDQVPSILHAPLTTLHLRFLVVLVRTPQSVARPACNWSFTLTSADTCKAPPRNTH